MQLIPVDLPDKIDALRRNSYFQGLGEPILKQLADGTSLRRYEPGEPVCWQGEVCNGLFILRKGSVKLFRLSPRGRELIIRTFSEGATFNEVPAFDRGENVVNVATLETSEIWAVDPQVIQRTLSEHPEMAALMIQNLASHLRMLVDKIEELSFYQITNRLARLLNDLSPDQLSGGSEMRLTQDQLAARLGTVREVVARSLRDLERSGAIRVERRQIEVLDREVLQDWAQTGG
jgi:CRP/FNR family transcriptional regulator